MVCPSGPSAGHFVGGYVGNGSMEEGGGRAFGKTSLEHLNINVRQGGHQRENGDCFAARISGLAQRQPDK